MDEGAVQRELIALIKGLLSIESMVDYFGGYVDITVAEAVTIFEEFCCNCNARASISSWIYIFGLAFSTQMVKLTSLAEGLWTLK